VVGVVVAAVGGVEVEVVEGKVVVAVEVVEGKVAVAMEEVGKEVEEEKQAVAEENPTGRVEVHLNHPCPQYRPEESRSR